MPDLHIQIQWHAADAMFAAAFVRDGQPWYLDGALVGMGDGPDDALDDLLGQADYLVREGGNFLTQEDISLEDRLWLFKLLDQGNEATAMQLRYIAIRTANGGRDPYERTPER